MYNTINAACLFILFNLISVLSPAQQTFRPFPQHANYSNGVIKPDHISQQQMDDSVRSFYDKWKARYIHSNAGEGQYYIWAEGLAGNKICVSEGQGYGMIIVALMAGYDTAAQNIYNGLYHYYKVHPSKRNPFLMVWAQTKLFKDVDGSSASDGDMDIAYSLLLANAQWGSKGTINYLNEAKSMIAAIMKQEINHTSFSVLLSNAIEPDSKDYFDMRSSDFMPAHFKVFGNITNDSVWKKVVDKNYALFYFMQNKYSEDAGLLPDFIQHINKVPKPSAANYLESKFGRHCRAGCVW